MEYHKINLSTNRKPCALNQVIYYDEEQNLRSFDAKKCANKFDQQFSPHPSSITKEVLESNDNQIKTKLTPQNPADDGVGRSYYNINNNSYAAYF